MSTLDSRVRLAAFAFLERLQQTHGETLPRAQLAAGFEFEGQRVPLLAPQVKLKRRLLPGSPVDGPPRRR